MNKIYIKCLMANLFAKKKSLFRNENYLDNIYFATTQKSGSLWVNSIFNDCRIKEYTGLVTYPQMRYEWDQFVKKFPKNTFVPGLYMSYDLYEEIEKTDKYKTIFITRDPRDIVVSWYHSMKDSHELMGKVPKYRKELRSLDYDAGLSYCIKMLAFKFSAMRTWFYNEDPNVLIIKFEDIVSDPFDNFSKIFNHCNLSLPDETLHLVLGDYTKSKMRKRDLDKKGGKSDSHYRLNKSSHKEAFKSFHYDLFDQVNGDLLNVLGYEH